MASPRPIDVLMLVEHVDRELDAMACLADRLERRHGLQVDIRNYYADLPYNLARYRPRVVLSPFFYELGTHPGVDYAEAWPQAANINMAWEQILYNVNKQIKIPRDTFSRERVTHVCWTEEYLAYLRSMGVPESRTVLAGNPVMRFYDPPLRPYFLGREALARRHGLDPRRKWVLFPENYRWAFVKSGQKKGFVRDGASAEWIGQAEDYCRQSLRILFQTLARLDRPDDPVFILRPRPATAAAEFEALIRETAPGALDRIRIVKAESARDWIIAADHVVSSYSTTLIEASLAGKPVNVFSPVPIPDALADSWYDRVPHLRSGDDLLAALRAAPEPGSAADLGAWARRTLLPAGDPYDVIADAVHGAWRAAGGETSAQADRARLGLFRSLFERNRKRLQRSAPYHAALRRKDPRYAFTLHKHEKDVFGADDVAARVARWRAVLPESA